MFGLEPRAWKQFSKCHGGFCLIPFIFVVTVSLRSVRSDPVSARLKGSKRKEIAEVWERVSKGMLVLSFCRELLAIQRSLRLNSLPQTLKACMPLICLPKWQISAAPWEDKSLSGEKSPLNT